jgi:rod shape-determining protein MreC
MSDFIRARQNWLVPLGFLLASFFFLSRQSYLGTRERPSLFARVLLSAVSLPQRAVSYPLQAGSRVWNNYLYLVGVRKKNLELQKELALLDEAKVAGEEYRLENERLRQLVEFKAQVPYRLVPARVIAEDLLAETNTITINKGSLDGVRAGMVVVSVDGVLGQILDEPGSAIGQLASQVLLIIDRNSRVDALVQRTRARGVIQGKGALSRLELQYVERTADVVPGDAIICSGLGGIFPKGLLIGTVASVKSNPGELGLKVEVAPSADFSRLEELLVVFPEATP